MQYVIELNNINLDIETEKIFSNFAHIFYLQNKIGIIDINSKKTSLLYKILKKEIQPDSGAVHFNHNYKIEFFDSNKDWEEEDIAIDYIIKSSKQDIYLCTKYSFLLGLDEEIIKYPIKKYPEDMKYILKMVSLLAKEPDFLVIFQPTYFLSLINQIFLENILKKYFYHKGFIIISNDLKILKNNCKDFFILKEEKFVPFVEKKEIHKIKKSFRTIKKYNIDFLKNFFYKYIYKILPIKKLILKTDMILKDHDISPFILESKIKLNKYSHYAIFSTFRENILLFLRTITNEIKPDSGDYIWKKDKIGHFFIEKTKGWDKNLTIEDLADFFSINDFEKLLKILEFFGIQNINLNEPIRNLDQDLLYKIYLIFVSLQNNDVLILERPEQYLNAIELLKLSFILKNMNRTILCYSYNRSFVELFITNIVEIQTKRVYLSQNSPLKYFSLKEYLVKKEFKEDLQKVIQFLFLSKESKKEIKKNGHSPLKVKDPNDPFAQKKALLLFFDQGYRERKREIAILKDELRKMEEFLRDIEKKRDELWEYIDKYKLYTPENYEKMNKLNKKLEELELKWNELQRKIEELEQQY